MPSVQRFSVPQITAADKPEIQKLAQSGQGRADSLGARVKVPSSRTSPQSPRAQRRRLPDVLAGGDDTTAGGQTGPRLFQDLLNFAVLRTPRPALDGLGIDCHRRKTRRAPKRRSTAWVPPRGHDRRDFFNVRRPARRRRRLCQHPRRPSCRSWYPRQRCPACLYFATCAASARPAAASRAHQAPHRHSGHPTNPVNRGALCARTGSRGPVPSDRFAGSAAPRGQRSERRRDTLKTRAAAHALRGSRERAMPSEPLESAARGAARPGHEALGARPRVTLERSATRPPRRQPGAVRRDAVPDLRFRHAQVI